MKIFNLKKIKNLGRKKLAVVFVAVIFVLTGSYFVAANYGFFGGGTNAPSVPEDTMTRGLVGSWSFNEGTGQTAYDASENGNNGTLGASATIGNDDPKWGAGKNGGGMEFDGVDDYAKVGYELLDNSPANGAVEMWIKPSVAVDSSTNWCLFTHGTSAWGGMQVCLGANGSQDIFFRVQENGTDHYLYSDTVTWNVDSWYHIVTTWGSGGMNIYVNGIESETGGFSQPYYGTWYEPENLINGIGASYNNNGDTVGSYLNGSIDSVRIYNRALSADEVRYHYNRGGPVGSWNFDEGSGLTAFDSTDNNNDGTLKSSGLEFDGVDDYVDVGSGGSLDITEIVTIEVWIKGINTTTYDGIVAKMINNNQQNYMLQMMGTQGMQLAYTHASASNEYLSYYNPEIGDNTWHHITGIINTVSGRMDLYKDGIWVTGKDTIAGEPMYTTANPLNIGKRADTGDIFDGTIGSVRIYNTALSAEEIARHYNGDFSQDPTANLVLLHHFEEGMACDANDEAGCLTDDSPSGTNDGTLKNFDNLTTWDNGTDGWVSDVKKESLRWTNGKHKTAGNFDGGGDNVYQVYDSDFDFGTGSFSISSWFKHNTIATSSDYLLSRYDADQGFKIWMDNSGDMCFGIDDDATWGPDDSACTSGIDYDDNAWHHLSAYKNGTTGIYLYIDGKQVASDETISATATLTSNSAPLRIGSDAPNPLNSWEGMIDSTMIYPYVRSADEIRLDYNAGLATHLGPSGKTCAQDPASCMDYGLVGSWGFDEGAGTTAYDSSDNSNDGTLTNGPVWTTDSPPSLRGAGVGSLSFDGVDDYVDAGNDASLDITGHITVEAWIYPKGYISNNNHGIVSNFNSGYRGYMLVMGHTNSYFWVANSEGTQEYAGGAYSVDVNTWHHITGVLDDSLIYLYIDGILKDTSLASGTIQSSNLNTLIGQNDYNNYFWNGSLDDVRIYNRALSADEVRYHYNKGGPVAHWKFDEGSGQKAYDSAGNADGQLGSTSTSDANDPGWSVP